MRRGWWTRGARALTTAALGVLGFSALFPMMHALIVPEVVRPAMAVPLPPPGTYTIHVVDWDYHTSIILPQPATWALGPPGAERAAYVEFAWGDRRFYRDSDFRPHSVFATLVLPTASVAYVAGRDRPPAPSSAAQAVYAHEVDAQTLHALAVELERTIRHDDRGVRVEPAPPVPGFTGRFYDAHGAYMWTRNCNRWTVERLAAIGLAGRSAMVVFSGQVAGRLRGFTPVTTPTG